MEACHRSNSMYGLLTITNKRIVHQINNKFGYKREEIEIESIKTINSYFGKKKLNGVKLFGE